MIMDMFRDFYSSLYASEHDSHPTFDRFFQNLNMPTITEESENTLENPITAEELNVAIKSLQNGKNPWPDGFPSEFF